MLAFVSTIRLHPSHSTKEQDENNASSTSNNVNVKLKWNHIMLIWIRVCVLFGTR